MAKIYGYLEKAQLESILPTAAITGQIGINSGKLKMADGTNVKEMVDLDSSQTISGKNISGATNTLSNVNLASQVTGTLPIANGGTGQTAQTAAFDALAPTTTKGDIIVSNGTDNLRLAVGTDGHVLTADSAQATGVKWAAVTAAANGADGAIQFAATGALSSDVANLKFDDATNQLLLGLGSATAPSFSFVGDQNTGMWSPTADTLAWSTNNAEKMRLDSSGRLAVGGTPTTNLIEAIATASDVLINPRNTTNGNFDIGFHGEGFNSQGVKLFYRNDDATVHLEALGASTELIFDVNGSERARIATNGKFGIGGTPTTNFFEVINATAADTLINARNTSNNNIDIGFFAEGFNSQSASYIYRNDDATARVIASGAAVELCFDVNGAERMQIDTSGVIHFQTAANETTGAGSASLGANSPAVTNSAPYKWLKVILSDASTVYIPCWK